MGGGAAAAPPPRLLLRKFAGSSVAAVASGAIGFGVYAFAMAHIRRQAIPGVRSRSNSLR